MISFLIVERPTDEYWALIDWLKQISWTSAYAAQWQKFFNEASRFVVAGSPDNPSIVYLPTLPAYVDSIPEQCEKNIPSSAMTFKLCSLIFMLISCLIKEFVNQVIQ